MPKLIAESLIRDVPDFPQPGILFKDITPVLADPSAMREVLDRMVEWSEQCKPDYVVGIESRGFVFGMPLAMRLNVGFIPVRKPGKLPFDCCSEEYSLEYGTNSVEIHIDAVKPGQKVLVIDDLLATGGTASAACRLIEKLGGVVCGCGFLIELKFLHGRKALEGRNVLSLIKFD